MYADDEMELNDPNQNGNEQNSDVASSSNAIGPTRTYQNRLRNTSAYSEINSIQIHHITLRNQLVPGREGGYLLSDPNGFLYRFNKTVNVTRYYFCVRPDCPGRCNVKNETLLTVTRAHGLECNPDNAQQQLRKFKAELIATSQDDLLTPLSKIYNRIQAQYPLVNVLLPFEQVSQTMYAARYRVTGRRIPQTMGELGEAMDDMQYRQVFGFDSSQIPQPFFHGVHRTNDGSEFAAFRSETIVNAARGGRIILQIDGTFSVVPNERYGGRPKFDKCQQLLMVHYRFRGRNYPIGYFLTTSLSEVTASAVFNLVNEWLGPHTHVERIISDFDAATRNAASAIWRNAQIQGCAIHFQRAVANWAYQQGVYRTVTEPATIHAVRMAFALCYLPQDYVTMGIDVIEDTIGASSFGQRFVRYLRFTWVGEDISVFGQIDRTNNGCEQFHWLIQRHHDKLNNNVNQFLLQLKRIESRCATQIRQFTKMVLSKKQQQTERRHLELANAFDLNLSTMPEVDTVRRFLNSTLHFADNVHNHYTSHGINNAKNVTGRDLLIAAKETESANTVTSQHDKQKPIALLFKPTDPGHHQRLFTLKHAQEIKVGRQNAHVKATSKNLIINDHNVDLDHATITAVIGNCIEIRDEGSKNGTFINGRRIGCKGVISPCHRIAHGSNLTFGNVEFKMNVLSCDDTFGNKGEASDNQEKLTITLHTMTGDNVPHRTIVLVKNVIYSIQRATIQKPPLYTNTMFKHGSVAWNHATIIWTGYAVQLKHISNAYHTWVNGAMLPSNKQVKLADGDQLILGSDIDSDHIRLVLDFAETDATPHQLHKWLDIELIISADDGTHKYILKPNDSIVIGKVPFDDVPNDQQLIFDNVIMSRKHALIQYTHDGRITITDLKSTNGTYLDKRQLIPNEAKQLQGNEILQFGVCDANAAAKPLLCSIRFPTPKCITLPQHPAPIRSEKPTFHVPDTFITLNRQTRALLGSFTLSTVPHCQDERYLAKQWTAAALATFVKLFVLPMSHWTTQTLNDVLYNADDLNMDIRLHMSHIQKSKSEQVEMQHINHLKSKLPLYDTSFKFDAADEPEVIGNLYSTGDAFALPLKHGILSFFEKHTTGLLAIELRSFAIFTTDNKYYVLHPERNFYSTNSAVLFQCENFESFMKILKQCLGNDCTTYTIHTIKIMEQQPQPGPSGLQNTANNRKYDSQYDSDSD